MQPQGKVFRIQIHDFETNDCAPSKGLTIFSIAKNSSKSYVRVPVFLLNPGQQKNIVDRSNDHFTTITTVSKKHSIGTPHTSLVVVGPASECARKFL